MKNTRHLVEEKLKEEAAEQKEGNTVEPNKIDDVNADGLEDEQVMSSKKSD